MTKTFTINDIIFTFECYNWETRYAWGHECTLYKDGEKLAYQRARYYNRTWEVYQYQSVMRWCICSAMEALKEGLKSAFKERNGLSRMSSKASKAFEEELQGNSAYNELLALNEAV